MRIFISLVSALLLCVITFQSAPTFAAKNKKVKVQRPYYSGIKFLSFKQVASLPSNARTQYIHELRQMFVEIEKTQVSFGKKTKRKGAQLTPEQKNDFYAILFGQEAHAAGECDPNDPKSKCPEHMRGRQCADKCVYAYNLNNYAKVNGQCKPFPFGCDKPPTCSRGGRTDGYQCGTMVSGLSGSLGCISSTNVRAATFECEQKRKSEEAKFLSSRVPNNAGQDYNGDVLLEKIENYFGFNDPDKKVRKANLEKDGAKAMVETLIKYRYSDKAYGLLIAVMQLYKNSDVRFPTDSTEIANLQRDFDGMNGILDGIFGDYMDMCNTPLAQDVVNDIDQLKNASRGPLTKKLEQARKGLLQQQKAGVASETCNFWDNAEFPIKASSDKATSCNVLQKPECIQVTRRMNLLKRVTDDLSRRMPLASDTAPPGVPPIDTAPPAEKIDPVGCSDGGELNNSLIFNNTGRCGLCAMEKSVHNDGAEGEVDDLATASTWTSKPKKSMYRVSKKWTALMSTMMKACGLSNHAAADIEQFNEMYQTFGHCSQDTYDWDTGDQILKPGDLDKIQAWGNYNYWNGDGSLPDKPGFWAALFGKRDKPEPDKNEDFARIFGISYATATNMFCDPSRFSSKDLMLVQGKDGKVKVKKKKAKKQNNRSTSDGVKLNKKAKAYLKEWVYKGKHTRSSKTARCFDPSLYSRRRDQNQCAMEKRQEAEAISAGNTVRTASGAPSTRAQRRANAMKRFEYTLKNLKIKNRSAPGIESVAKGLESCLEESRDRSEEYYSPNKSENMCMAVKNINGRELEIQMKSKTSPGNVIVDNKSCLIGHQVQKHGKGDSKTSLGFVDADVRPNTVQRPIRGSRDFYTSTQPMVADSAMARNSMSFNTAQANLRKGLSIDFYGPSNSIYNVGRNDEQGYAQMTVQVSCSEYWGSPDYSTPGQTPKGNK